MRPAFVLLAVGMCGGCRGRYGASATLGQVWRGGSKQEGVQRRCLEREGGWWALHRQQLSFRSGVQSRLMFEMCGGWAELFFLCRIFYFVRRERRTDGRKASLLACGRVAAPLIAILLTAGRFGYELSADVQARGDIVAGGAVWCFCQVAVGWFGWFYLVRRERRTDGRKASSLACVRVAAPLMAILLPAGPVKLVLPSRLAVL